jgi:hypothetical protein
VFRPTGSPDIGYDAPVVRVFSKQRHRVQWLVSETVFLKVDELFGAIGIHCQVPQSLLLHHNLSTTLTLSAKQIILQAFPAFSFLSGAAAFKCGRRQMGTWKQVPCWKCVALPNPGHQNKLRKYQ